MPLVWEKIAQNLIIEEEYVQITLAYARHCNYDTVAAMFSKTGDEVGLIVRATTPRLYEWAMARNTFLDEIVKHPKNRISYLPANIIGSVDTVPIYVTMYDDGYQPKRCPSQHEP